MKVFLIPHTHWDREWYFTLEDSKILSTFMFDKIWNTLENNKEYLSFLLDGQTSIIEDYLELKPHNINKIKKLTKNKKLFFGPWYTQTDSFYVHAESIIRNLELGIKKANELGGSMMVGYLPDTFGHNEQIPQILNIVGIDNVVFWRGFDDEQTNKDPYFNWNSPDGSKVLAINLTHGYGAAKWLKDDKNMWDNKTIPMVDKIEKRTSLDIAVLPSGGDQVLIDNDLPRIVKKLDKYSKHNFVLSNYPEFINELKKTIQKEKYNLKEYQGEFRTPQYARVHRSIGSVRYDIKKKNSDLEELMINKLEPLLVLYQYLSKNIVNEDTIDYIWKLILDGHAHDSMGGCNTDATNTNIINRFEKARQAIDGLLNIYKKLISKNIFENYKNDLVIFNYDLKKIDYSKKIKIFSNYENIKILDKNNSEININIISKKKISGGRIIIVTPDGDKEQEVDNYYEYTLYLKTELPSFGYKSLKILEEKSLLEIKNTKNNFIENKNLKISLENNKINLLNKKTNEQINNFLYFENVGDDGDSYDFSPLKNDSPITDIEIKNITSYSIKEYGSLSFEAFMKLPEKLENRNKRSKNNLLLKINAKIILNPNNTIDFKFIIVNNIKDHRLRAIINTNIDNDVFYTDIPFGFTKRNITSINKNWKEFMVEYPVNIYPLTNTAYINGKKSQLVINTKGIREIQGIKNSKTLLALTLFKAHGLLGKNNLEWRPNRASGINNKDVHTPDAQLINQKLVFDFNISLNDDIENEYEILNSRKSYLELTDFYQWQSFNTFYNRLERFELPFENFKVKQEETFLSLKGDVIYSSLRPTFKSNKDILLRYYELEGKNKYKLTTKNIKL